MRIKSLLMLLVAIIALSSCSKKGDKEIEKQFIGTWTFTESEEDDGIEYFITSEISYYEDNTYEESVYFIYPEFSSLGYDYSFSIKCTGEWYATKREISEKIDENSFKFHFSKDFLDLSEMSAKQAKNELMEEMASSLISEFKIISIDTDKITLSDEDGKFTMYRN